MASFLYDSFTKNIANGSIDLDTDTIKVALCSSSYSPSQTGHDYFDDVTNEVSGTGYTAGGMALSSKVLTLDTGNHRSVWDADDPSWSDSTITARYGVIYKDTGTASTSPLIALIDFGQNLSTSLSTFSVALNASGILRITNS